jgi:hypothetical protein
MDAIKTRIAATDEEFKVIGPQLRKVMAARRAAEAGIVTDPASALGGAMRNFGARGPMRRDSFMGPGGGPRIAPGSSPSTAPGTTTAPAGPADRPPPPEGARPEGPPPGGRPPAGGGPPPGGGPPGNVIAGAPGGGRGSPNAVSGAIADLQAVVEAKAAPDILKEKMTAVRAAREKARVTLATEQAELRELLTDDQEAILVSMGLID